MELCSCRLPFFFFSSRRRHTRWPRDWSSDVCSSDLDGYWRIGIQNPFQSRGNFNAILRAYDQSVVTSGIYERKLTINNRTYHHILDPKTGYPIETEIASLTIVSKESIDGEIWTGRLFGQTPQQIMATLNQLPNVDGIVITKDNDMYYSDTLKPYLTETVS